MAGLDPATQGLRPPAFDGTRGMIPPGAFQRQAPLRGVLWMVAAAFFLAVSVGLVRHLSETISAFEQTFWRQLMGTVILLPYVWRVGLRGLRSGQPTANVVRAFAGYAGLAMSFYSVTLIPLAESLALQFTLPMFTIVFAVILLGERVGAHRWAATLVGFLGALVILRPGFAEINLGMVTALAAAASFGVSDSLVRRISRTDSTTLLVFYGYALQIPIALAVALFDWVTPSAADWPPLLALGLCSFAAQWALSRAFTLAEASLVSPVLFIRLPMVSAIGWLFFGQVTDVWTWTGALIIFASTCYAARREALRLRAARAAKAD